LGKIKILHPKNMQSPTPSAAETGDAAASLSKIG